MQKTLGNRVVAGAAEGMATKDAPERQPETLQGAVLAERLKGILRACGCEAAAVGQVRGDTVTVKLYQ